MNYTFSSPVTLSFDGDDIVTPNREVVYAINARLGYDETDLAEYLAEDLELLVCSVTMEARLGINGITCRTTCVVEEELKPGLLNKLSDFITAQFSGSWGECFEQEEFTIGRHEKFYASFWSEDHWSLDVVGFSTVNIDE